MPAPLYVQIWHDGQCLQEVPFTGDRVQIGRLPENDVVLNHLSVSRIHAHLERDGSEVMVEDLGSQNGVWFGEERIAGRAIAPFDEPIRIGQHEIRLRRESDAADDAEFPTPIPATLDGPTGTASDLVGERPLPPVVRPGLSGERRAAQEPADHGAAAVTGEALADLSPFAIDEDEIADDAPLPDGVAELSAEELFDVDDDPTSLVDYTNEEISAVPDGQALHPGLIIQESGQIDRVIVWDREELVAGRGSRCQVLLQAPEVSRRHARFVREGERYEVRDLGSINGVFVNGTRVNHHQLQVGDVVRIDAFEITFVLDPQPITDGVQVATAAEMLDASGTDQQHPTRMAGDRARDDVDWSGAPVSELPEVDAEPSREPAIEAEGGADGEPEGLVMAEDLDLDESVEPAELDDLDVLDEVPFASSSDVGSLDPPADEPSSELVEPAVDTPSSELVEPAVDTPSSEPAAPLSGVGSSDPAEPLPALDLLDESQSEDDDPEKDETEAPFSTLELEISVESLPEDVRRALAVLEEEAITVPVRLRLRR